MAELATTGTDVEQIANRRHARANERRDPFDVIRRVDGGGVELDRIDRKRRRRRVRMQRRDGCSSTAAIGERAKQSATRGNRGPVTATAAALRSPAYSGPTLAGLP